MDASEVPACRQCGQSTHAIWQAYDTDTGLELEGLLVCGKCKPPPWDAHRRSYFFRPVWTPDDHIFGSGHGKDWKPWTGPITGRWTPDYLEAHKEDE